MDRKAYEKLWRVENRNKKLIHKKTYREKNPEIGKAYRKHYNTKNKEYVTLSEYFRYNKVPIEKSIYFLNPEVFKHIHKEKLL